MLYLGIGREPCVYLRFFPRQPPLSSAEAYKTRVLGNAKETHKTLAVPVRRN